MWSPKLSNRPIRPNPFRGLTLGIIISVFFILPLTSFATADNAPTPGIGAGALHEKLINSGDASGFTNNGAANRTLSTIRLATFAGTIVQAALVLIGLIFLTLTVYGGVMYLTASGNEEQVKKAVQIIRNTLIGILIVIFAGAIIQFLDSQISRPVTPPAQSDEYTSTTLLGGCPTGYTYILLATPTGPQNLTGPACRRQ